MTRSYAQKTYFSIIAIFSNVLHWFLRVTIHHQDISGETLMDGKTPVCYVLKYHSLIDWLVLVQLCKIHKLPRPYFKPSAFQTSAQGAYFFFNKRGWIQTTNRKVNPPGILTKLFSSAMNDNKTDCLFIPVNIFWGKNPGKEDSPLKLMFFDEDYAGLLQRFFTIIFQARRINVRFGKAVRLRDLLDSSKTLNPDEAAKKLRRVIRVHFHQARVAMLGPQLYSQELAIKWILRSPVIQESIRETAEKNQQSIAKAQASAEKMVREISANTSYAVIRMFEIVLPRIWKKLYDGVEIKNGEYLRTSAEDAEIIYLPCHRSHFDYLLIGYFIHQFGLMVPHIGGGDNLNFFPVGMFLRRAGAFFLRRKFGGNRLYTAIFNEYIHYVVNKRHPIAFFIEGGRSRSGKLLQPKTGMLAMVLHSYARNPRPIKIVPVSITYDQVVEQDSYRSELLGAKKKKENFLQLISAARSIFKHNYGKAHLKFAPAIDLEKFFDVEKPDWRQHISPDMAKPTWLTPIVSKVAQANLEKINETTIISPVALLSTFLLAPSKNSLSEEDIIRLIELTIQLHNHTPYGPGIEFPEMTPGEILSYALRISKINAVKQGDTTMIFAKEEEAPLLNYYKNNIAHIFALPSLICNFFTQTDHFESMELKRHCLALYPLLKQEYFLPWTVAQAESKITIMIDSLLAVGLLSGNGSTITRPAVDSREFFYMSLFGRMTADSLERMAITTLMLANFVSQKPLCSIEDIITKAQSTNDQYAIVNGTTNFAAANKSAYQQILNYYHFNNIMKITNDGKLELFAAFEPFRQSASWLIRKDFAESLNRIQH